MLPLLLLLSLLIPSSLSFSPYFSKSRSTLSSCYDVTPGRVLVGSAIALIRDVSLERCQMACNQMDNPICRSFTFHEGRCELNSETKDQHRAGFFPSSGRGDYYQRTCFAKSNERVLRDDSLFEDNCYEVIKGKVLIGIVDQLLQDISSLDDCKKACQKSQKQHDVVCKSAAFYASDKECIIASQSRHDIADLFIDDAQAVYIENSCLAKAEKGDDVKKIEPATTRQPEVVKEKKEKVVNSNDATVADDDTNQGLITMLHSPAPIGHLPTKSTGSQPGKAPMVEQSGYDSPSDGMIVESKSQSQTEATPTPTPKIVDSYAVETTKKTSSYNRRLRDSKIATCFKEVLFVSHMAEARVVRAYSLEQCTDICRLCWRCLRGKMCKGVAYDSSGEMCALSLSAMDSGLEQSGDSNIVYMNRGEC